MPAQVTAGTLSERAAVMSVLDSTGPDGGKWEPAQSVHPEDDDTTEEEFGGPPEDDDTTELEDELLGAQSEDARPTEWTKVDPVLWRGKTAVL